MARLDPSASVASVRDVATLAGVSVGTVSNVLNHPEKVSAAVAERVNAAIEELGYVRNEAARQLRVGRSTSIGLIVLDVRNPFFTDVARGAEDAASEAGVSVILGNSGEDPDREANYLALFETQRVQGVLISPVGDIAERLRRLRSRGTPVVLVDRESADGSVSSVSVDDAAGGRLACEHLVETGRRRIAFVGGPLGIQQVSDRLRGASDALAAHPGVSLEVIETRGLTVHEGRNAGEAIAARPASQRPDAVFAANDLVAVGLLQALVMTGAASVPDDIALIGFDDIDFASAAVVPLSSVRQPRQELGEAAVRLLLDEVNNPSVATQRVIFQPELVVRDSTRPPGAPSRPTGARGPESR